jgi:hypothetical protein
LRVANNLALPLNMSAAQNDVALGLREMILPNCAVHDSQPMGTLFICHAGVTGATLPLTIHLIRLRPQPSRRALIRYEDKRRVARASTAIRYIAAELAAFLPLAARAGRRSIEFLCAKGYRCGVEYEKETLCLLGV